MTDDKSASTNVQSSESSDLQDDMTQEAFTQINSIKHKQLEENKWGKE